MTSLTEPQGVCLCSHCLLAKPMDDFRRRRKDEPSRQRTCRACHAAIERERRAFHRSRREQRTVRKFVSQVKAAPSTERIAVLLRVAESQLGGIEKFAAAWNRNLEAARRLPDGHRRTIDSLNTVIRLGIAVAELSPKPSFDDMTDEELRDAQDRLFGEYLDRNLPTLIETLTAQGWSISPPVLAE